MNALFKTFARLLCCAIVVLVSGCEPTVAVKVESDVPQALVSRAPVTMGVYYDSAFRNHVYAESSEDRPNWTVDSGSSQVALFDRVLASMFRSTLTVDGIPAPGSPVDAIIAPEITDMQFATPDETGFDFYEAWIRYNIKLVEPNGEPITDWVFTAYGKAAKKGLKRKGTGINEAMELALRDAGAKFSLGFQQVPEVRDWLEKRSR